MGLVDRAFASNRDDIPWLLGRVRRKLPREHFNALRTNLLLAYAHIGQLKLDHLHQTLFVNYGCFARALGAEWLLSGLTLIGPKLHHCQRVSLLLLIKFRFLVHSRRRCHLVHFAHHNGFSRIHDVSEIRGAIGRFGAHSCLDQPVSIRLRLALLKRSLTNLRI